MHGVPRALLAGTAGALALTAIHQIGRLVTDSAPRMDILGMRALAHAIEAIDDAPPLDDKALYYTTLGGDLVSNTLYYSLAATAEGGKEVRRGFLLGIGAGIGAVVLPPVLGLGAAPSARTPATAAMTVVWYTVGGLAAAIAARELR